ncbi:hypothetical protein [Photobacterium sanguinicancri]|uniref:hypothetical protein n=1 Tax=Photobacterium sanguinicancri TaxID=875932 RepID=UPI00078893BE|nr:hypothetical protein [Photobacterium sanguinicancri]KXI23331.1 hypothetical protein AS132_08275 [Photobacterium sanguinicancri]
MELVIKFAPWISALVALFATWLNVKWRREDQELKHLDQQYKDRHIYFESNQSWSHPLRLSKPDCVIRITNRDSRDITIREVCWAQIDNETTWQCDSIDRSIIKLQPSDSYEFGLDADGILSTPFLNDMLSESIKMQYITALRMQVSLSTGECRKFMVGPYVQFYLLETNVESGFYKFLGRHLIKRAHYKALKRSK